MKNVFPLFLCLFLFTFCQNSTAPTVTASVEKVATTTDLTQKKTIIRKNIAAFSQALMNEDYDFVVNAYTEDAKIFPNGMKILAGHEAIRQYWTPPAGSKRKMAYHKVTPDEIKIIGNEAYDYGYYEGISIGDDEKEYPFKGKYVITWKEVEPDVWKMYLDIWNSVRE